ncbi:MAG: peptidoglycan DD-metalloendopeptidase family protein [Candidatus Marinimicrobia bacterium]|nr:peptidoglycan DD-metalloendopeptidase family protein [Candidatus Neomarinimicrobiota bacterium]
MHKRVFSIFFLMFFFCVLAAQDLEEFDRKIDRQSKNLEQVSREIEALQKRIKSASHQELTYSDELEYLDRQIGLTDRRISAMEQQLSLRRGKVALLKKNKARNEVLRDKLIERYKKRVVRFYTTHTDDMLSLIFTSDNMHQLFYRVKYFNAITKADKELYQEIITLIEQIEQETREIEAEKTEIQKTLAEVRKEAASFRDMKADRAKKLEKVKSDRKMLVQELEAKEASRMELQRIIASMRTQREDRLRELERQRRLRAASMSYREYPTFSSGKGNLPWPVQGTVVGRFGRQIHPVLKTETENNGIDIKAPEKTPVMAIQDGLVTTVTWLRGYGNTIIIMHGEDYYTVYSHVGGIRVSENEYVESGQVIAEVSDSGSFQGHLLHFEIWDSRQKLNPEEWLCRRN